MVQQAMVFHMVTMMTCHHNNDCVSCQQVCKLMLVLVNMELVETVKAAVRISTAVFMWLTS